MKKKLFYGIILTSIMLNAVALNVSYSKMYNGEQRNVQYQSNDASQGEALNLRHVIRYDFNNGLGLLNRFNYRSHGELGMARDYILGSMCEGDFDLLPMAAQALGECLRRQGGYSNKHIDSIVDFISRI